MSRNENSANDTRRWNRDETGLKTMQNPKQAVAGKGLKEANQATHAEERTLVTTCCFISAAGNAVPPAMVFPRDHFNQFMIKNAPPPTSDVATRSRLMTSGNFTDAMKYFIKHINSSKENPSLVLLDNHKSYFSISMIDAAKEHRVRMLTFHPHYSHELQRLGDAVCFPFKAFYAASVCS
jgi:hypothetical protein